MRRLLGDHTLPRVRAVGVGICVVFVAGMIRVVGVVCFRSGVITMVIAGMVGSAHDVPFAQPGRGRDDG